MRKLTLVLSCLACVGLGRRVLGGLERAHLAANHAPLSSVGDYNRHYGHRHNSIPHDYYGNPDLHRQRHTPRHDPSELQQSRMRTGEHRMPTRETDAGSGHPRRVSAAQYQQETGGRSIPVRDMGAHDAHQRRINAAQHRQDTRQPCPVYQGMEVSKWEVQSNNYLRTRVTLPGVKIGHHQVTLDDDSNALKIRAVRTLPGRHACLPRDAQISEDGNSEILETVSQVNAGWDASRATVRQVHGGLEIIVPLREEPSESVPQAGRRDTLRLQDSHAHTNAHQTPARDTGASEVDQTGRHSAQHVRQTPKPCPAYQRMEVSQWEADSNGKAAVRVTLPGVETRHQQVSLDESGTALKIKAVRALPARRACLPRNAQISEDGSAEIFEQVVSVPAGFDASRATVRRVHGKLEIHVPLIKPAAQMPGHERGTSDSYEAGQRHTQLRQEVPQSCPEYQGIEVSDWVMRGKGIWAARVALPGVNSKHHQVSVDESGTGLKIWAARPLPSRQVCLPTDTKVLEDRSAEILETVVSVPADCDASRATVRNVQGGLEILVPMSKPSVEHVGQTGRRDTSDLRTSNSEAGEQESHYAGLKHFHRAGKQEVSYKTRTCSARAAWLCELPSSHGIEVIEEDFPHPEKNSDAAEGYWDNRGMFQYY